MKKIFGCWLVCLVMTQVGNAQTRYVIKFRNKGDNPYSLSNPGAYLSQRAIERRTRFSIPLDSTDLPVTPRYIDSIRLAGNVTVMNASKWLNSVSIQTTDAAALAKINSFPFVVAVAPLASRAALTNRDKFDQEKTFVPLPPLRETGVLSDYFNYGSSYAQVHIHNGEFLHNIGLRGQNMLVGMLDAGFQNYLTVSSLDSIRTNGQILGTWDFVMRESSVNEDHSHGLQCLSIIAANIPGQFVGTAPKANFYLIRSEETGSEYPVEEHNWVCGAERVDSIGGDLISSSLGYSDFDTPLNGFDHTYADMNGNTTMPAIGADLAAKKGILVVNSAGNEGNNTWHYILTPADGDSVLAVGAVNASGAVASFSSYGPSSDGQVKPDVASVGQGTIIQSPNNVISGGNGTSFSAPNMAGLATSLWQGFPEFNNMKIISALRQAGSKATAPDDRVGYGIPDMKKALMILLKQFVTSSATISNCTTTINWTSKDVGSMKYEIERMLPGFTTFTKIGEKNGTGTIFGTRPAYQFEDDLANATPGTITYRIRQVIDTALATQTSDYIATLTVNLETVCPDTLSVQGNSIRLIPNPARNHFTLEVSTIQAVPNLFIQLLNNKGQQVGFYYRSKPAGRANFEIPVHYLPRGIYYVVAYDDGKMIQSKKLLKL
jgi:serine protease AprX